MDAAGDLFIADTGNNRIREVNAARASSPPSPATEAAGYSGDGGPATAAELDNPSGVAVDAAGDLFIADTGNNCIREVNARTRHHHHRRRQWRLRATAATAAGHRRRTVRPYGVAVDAGGDLFIADTGNNRIREVNAATASSPPSPATAPRAIAATADRPPPPS